MPLVPVPKHRLVPIHSNHRKPPPHEESSRGLIGHLRARCQLREAAAHAKQIGLAVHAGHGLTYQNVQPVAAIPEIEELNIGHSIVSNAVFWGMEEAVRRMAQLVKAGRRTSDTSSGM